MNTCCIIYKVEDVEIHCYYLFLGIALLKLHCSLPLLELGNCQFCCPYNCRVIRQITRQEEVLGQLLGDGTAPSGLFPEKNSLDKNPGKTPEVDTRMPVKPNVFSSNQCIDDIRRDVFIFSPCAVLNVEFAQQDIIFGIYLCSKVAGRVLKLLE